MIILLFQIIWSLDPWKCIFTLEERDVDDKAVEQKSKYSP